MNIIRAALATLAMLLISAPLARAQEPAPQQYEAMMRWAGAHQNILQGALAPFQQMPPPFDESSVGQRTAWVSLARTWASSTLAAVQSARRQAEQLGPPPEAGELSGLYRTQERAIYEVFGSIEAFLVEYTTSIIAIERNDPNALQLASISSIDAQLIIQTQFRNINAIQAEAVGEGPQRHLLRAFASSYDGLITMLQARRSAYLGDDATGPRAPLVRASADAMRLHVQAGRASVTQTLTSFGAGAPPEQGDFIRRARIAVQSFEGSYDRELRIAGLFDDAAALMASGRGYIAIEGELNTIVAQMGILDSERLVDIQRRIQLMQYITPPT
ncbi:hypothetical protein [Vitreimonas sp.]|uniref:hypothetical protein n=1 Tax=Vitreimonas sp. TaxID=3069702 RepID=UPI002EDA4787